MLYDLGKTMKKLTIFLITLSLCLIGGLGLPWSHGQTYKWVDDQGAVHFTDDLSRVPERYRKGLEKIGTSDEKADTPSQGAAVGPEKKEGPGEDLLGRGETYWKGRVKEWREKIKSLEERQDGLRRKYNELVERYNESKSTAERASLRKEREQVKADMDRNKAEIEEAKHMLEKKIPEEAEIFKAKREWLQ